MSEFKNVTLVKAANVYFDGRVNSRTVVFADGSKKTLGFMQPGEYTFNTGAPEVMEVLGGAMDYKLLPDDEWATVAAGESFDVPGDISFSVRVSAFADYCCSYTE
jgi:uncharacterized protein YaiE (UPF0345 family)